jgi:hypothetical protein
LAKLLYHQKKLPKLLYHQKKLPKLLYHQKLLPKLLYHQKQLQYHQKKPIAPPKLQHHHRNARKLLPPPKNAIHPSKIVCTLPDHHLPAVPVVTTAVALKSSSVMQQHKLMIHCFDNCFLQMAALCHMHITSHVLPSDENNYQNNGSSYSTTLQTNGINHSDVFIYYDNDGKGL